MSEFEEVKRRVQTNTGFDEPSDKRPHSKERTESYDEEEALKESRELNELSSALKHKLKNGCCKECMKAFSKSSRVTLHASYSN